MALDEVFESKRDPANPSPLVSVNTFESADIKLDNSYSGVPAHIAGNLVAQYIGQYVIAVFCIFPGRTAVPTFFVVSRP